MVKMKRVSLVVPVYNEEDNIKGFYDATIAAASKLKEYEIDIIFIDDCSRDMTPNVLEDLRGTDRRVGILRLSRNCGTHAAVSAGLNHCTADAAIILAADLQEPPQIIVPKMVQEWKAGASVVWGVRKAREGEGIMTILFSRLFYKMINCLTVTSLPESGVGAILVDRCVIDAYNQIDEKNPSVAMLIAWLGFSQKSISYISEPRRHGKPKWTFTKKIKLALDSIISFSYTPIRFMSLMGMVCTVIGMVYASHILFNRLVHNVTVEGWASLMMAVLLIGGIQMMMLGVLGEYVWRTYDESRGRPRYVIEKNTLANK